MDNVLKFPDLLDTEMLDDSAEAGLFLDLSDIDPSSMEKIFDVMNFFSQNSDEIINKNKEKVIEFVSSKGDFSDKSLTSSYNLAFRELVMSFLKDEIVSHFNYTPEEISIIMDEDFIDIITDGVFFDMNNYITEDINE